jgi:hypothetical protein
MSSAVGSDQLVGILDRIGHLYPRGIPTSAIRADNSFDPQTVPRWKFRCAIIAVGSSEPLDESLATLAQAICTKGLRLPLDECAILAVTSESCEGEALESLVARVAAPVVVLCGGRTIPGTLRELEGTVILSSYSLSEVACVVETKRGFWEHLKLIVPRL